MSDEPELRVLLGEATGLESEPGTPIHVRLDEGIGATSLQRAGLDRSGDRVVLSVWPGELKPQARHLYSHGRAQRLVALADANGSDALPAPHLAFHTAPPGQRAYLTCRLALADYVGCWSGSDHGHIGAYPREAVKEELWPWLLRRGYASPEDAPSSSGSSACSAGAARTFGRESWSHVRGRSNRSRTRRR